MDDAPLSLVEADAQLTAPGAMFEVDHAVIGGIDTKVWRHAPANLRHVLDLSLRHGDQEFLVYESERVSFEEHYRLASNVSQRFIDLGITKGDRVAIVARNLPQWITCFWGAVICGAVVVPLNAWWTSDELAYGLSDSGASIAVVDYERLERIQPLLDGLPELSLVVVIGDRTANQVPTIAAHSRVRIVDFEQLLGEINPDATPPDVLIDTDDDATMFYTSGTTGRPKGAVGTHRNAITNLMNMFYVAQRHALRFGCPDEPSQNLGTSHLLNVPLFHATGCLSVMIPNTAAGGKIIMTHHFDAQQALELIAREHLTHIGGVPTIAMQILDHPNFGNYDTSSVRSVSYGGAPAPPELVKRIRAAFALGQPGNGYGLTETSAAVSMNTGPDYVAKPESCGTALPVCEVAIVPEGFQGPEPTPELPRGPNVIGELWIKGPNVVRGYWRRPDATDETFTKGWLHSGDIARLDDEGFIYIVDRAKDMIIRGGENVYSVIVEAAIFELPDVADCAVVGVPHPVLGEEVAAVIVLRAGRVIEAEDVSRHVAARLARFSVPTRIFFRSEPLPRNPQGKVLKRELRDSLEELLDRHV